eukprot:CAMPEP_0198538574 /NCGR_PEP_ID=MMETSP1462-20131121/47945_1 /TAXON_ID=1333877 /ORGANISM="Brandtodinium nutriculum, Strain RCC3387" /LENGTH=60 /DNA_ID=CAMNT_0044268601 /DNA_START=214 /DNA_END=397 /DNA_ORIENTATION=+
MMAEPVCAPPRKRQAPKSSKASQLRAGFSSSSAPPPASPSAIGNTQQREASLAHPHNYER